MLGVISGDHLRKRQIEPRRGAEAGDRLFRRRALGARHRLAHEGIEGLLDPAAKNPVGLARGVLKLDDIHLVAEALAEQLDRIGRRAIGMRRVDADHAGDAVDMPQRHLPDNKAAPVVADEDRLVDLQMVEQADQIAGQVLDVVGLDRFGPIGRAIAALVGAITRMPASLSALIWWRQENAISGQPWQRMTGGVSVFGPAS